MVVDFPSFIFGVGITILGFIVNNKVDDQQGLVTYLAVITAYVLVYVVGLIWKKITSRPEIDPDDTFVITEKGRKYLEELKKND